MPFAYENMIFLSFQRPNCGIRAEVHTIFSTGCPFALVCPFHWLNLDGRIVAMATIEINNVATIEITSNFSREFMILK